MTCHLPCVDALTHALTVRSVDEHRGRSGCLDGEAHLADTGPVLPVRGREGVEVRAERHSSTRDDTGAVSTEDVAQVGAVRHPNGLFVDDRPGLGVRVQRKQVGIAVEREDDVLQYVGHEVQAYRSSLGNSGESVVRSAQVRSDSGPSVAIAPV